MGIIDTQALKKLTDKEMDRKDFLKYSGVVLLGVIGLKGVMALLTQAEKPIASDTQANRSGKGCWGSRDGASPPALILVQTADKYNPGGYVLYEAMPS
mgnify:CR=1 FL=1